MAFVNRASAGSSPSTRPSSRIARASSSKGSRSPSTTKPLDLPVAIVMDAISRGFLTTLDGAAQLGFARPSRQAAHANGLDVRVADVLRRDVLPPLTMRQAIAITNTALVDARLRLVDERTSCAPRSTRSSAGLLGNTRHGELSLAQLGMLVLDALRERDLHTILDALDIGHVTNVAERHPPTEDHAPTHSTISLFFKLRSEAVRCAHNVNDRRSRSRLGTFTLFSTPSALFVRAMRR